MVFKLEPPNHAVLAGLSAELLNGWRIFEAGQPQLSLAMISVVAESAEGETRVMAYRLLACISVARRDPQSALDAMLMALEIDPGSMACRHGAALLLEELGHRALAAEIHDQTVSDAPLDVGAWAERAAFKLRAGDLNGALVDLRRALLTKPDHVPTILGQARVYRQLHRRTAAAVEAA